MTPVDSPGDDLGMPRFDPVEGAVATWGKGVGARRKGAF